MAGVGIVTIIDDTAGDGSLTYVGYTTKDLVDSSDEAVWGIKKVTVDTTTTTTSWASDQLNQIWDDRSSLIYS